MDDGGESLAVRVHPLEVFIAQHQHLQYELY